LDCRRKVLLGADLGRLLNSFCSSTDSRDIVMRLDPAFIVVFVGTGWGFG